MVEHHLLIFSLLASSVLSYSSGPPSSACSSLTPGHSGITFNENSSNIKIDILDASKGLINVAINSQKPFKGTYNNTQGRPSGHATVALARWAPLIIYLVGFSLNSYTL